MLAAWQRPRPSEKPQLLILKRYAGGSIVVATPRGPLRLEVLGFPNRDEVLLGIQFNGKAREYRRAVGQALNVKMKEGTTTFEVTALQALRRVTFAVQAPRTWLVSRDELMSSKES